jgi:hypothetical protein
VHLGTHLGERFPVGPAGSFDVVEHGGEPVGGVVDEEPDGAWVACDHHESCTHLLPQGVDLFGDTLGVAFPGVLGPLLVAAL